MFPYLLKNIVKTTCFYIRALSPPQVRSEVHKIVAEVTSWSLSISGAGVWPANGFRGEPLVKGTTRFNKQGKKLASGFKTFGFCL